MVLVYEVRVWGSHDHTVMSFILTKTVDFQKALGGLALLFADVKLIIFILKCDKLNIVNEYIFIYTNKQPHTFMS